MTPEQERALAEAYQRGWADGVEAAANAAQQSSFDFPRQKDTPSERIRALRPLPKRRHAGDRGGGVGVGGGEGGGGGGGGGGPMSTIDLAKCRDDCAEGAGAHHLPALHDNRAARLGAQRTTAGVRTVSDEKLVTVEPSDALGFELRIAGRFVCADADRAALDSLAHAAVAAVDQREARLVAALRGMVDAVNRHVDGERDGITRAISAAWSALEGKGDYVPRAELEAEQAKTRGVWAVLADVANEGGLASERAAELMRALGMRTDFVPFSERQSAVKASGDGDLLAELLRRGYNIDPLRAQFAERRERATNAFVETLPIA